MRVNSSLLNQSLQAIRPHATPMIERIVAALVAARPDLDNLLGGEGMNHPAVQRSLFNHFVHLVEYAGETDHLGDYFRKLGGRVVASGLDDAFFDQLRTSVIETLAFAFDSQWSDELHQSWSTLLDFAVREIKKGLALPKAQKSVKNAVEQAFEDRAFQEALRQRVRSLLMEMGEEESRSLLRAKVQPERSV